MDDLEQEPWLRIGLGARLVQQAAEDAPHFLEQLAQSLQEAVPGTVEVHRGGNFLQASRPVRELKVTLGESAYVMSRANHGGLVAQRISLKRGIALRTDALTVNDWIAEFAEALERLAEENAAAARAIHRLTG